MGKVSRGLVFAALIGLAPLSRVLAQQSKTVSLTFVATDDRATAVPGCRVTVDGPQWWPETAVAPLAEGETDARGVFTCQVAAGYYTAFLNPPFGSGLVLCQVNGEVPRGRWSSKGGIFGTGRVCAGPGEPLEFHLVLRKRGEATIRGRITDEDGKPVGGCVVTIADGTGVRWEMTTSAGGEYNVPGLYWMNPYDLSILPPEVLDLVPARLSIGLGESDEVRLDRRGVTTRDFQLRKGGAIAGRVTDEKGKPVGGAGVVARLTEATEEGPGAGYAFPGLGWRPGMDVPEGRRAVTDGEGSYVIHSLHRESFAISVYPPKGAPLAPVRNIQGFAVKPGVQVRGDVELPPGGSLSGLVLGPHGEPVADASVSGSEVVPPRRGPDYSYERGLHVRAARTDSQGRYHLTPLPTGLFRLFVTPPPSSGLPAKSFDRVLTLVGVDLRQDLQLDQGGTVQGRVTDESGRPVGGARVGLGEYSPVRLSGVTDPEGLYAIKGVPPLTSAERPSWPDDPTYGLYKLDVQVSDPTSLLCLPEAEAKAKAFKIGPGETITRDLTLREGCVIKGKVRNAKYGPAASAKVVAYYRTEPHRAERWGQATAEANGCFRMLLADDWTAAKLAVLPAQDDRDSAPIDLGTVSLRPGGVIAMDIVLRKGGILEGVVRDQSGAPIEDLLLSAEVSGERQRRELSGGRWYSAGAYSDEKGCFRITGLLGESYDLGIAWNYKRFGVYRGPAKVDVRLGEVLRVDIVIET